jgi:mono/diheme cytochrome c family protein
MVGEESSAASSGKPCASMKKYLTQGDLPHQRYLIVARTASYLQDVAILRWGHPMNEATYRIKRWLLMMAVLGGTALVALGAYVYSGHYNIAADQPHWFVTAKIIETLRDRSIESRAGDIVIPDLEDSRLVLKGAGQYDAMCSGCHLTPGVNDSEIRQGLYPQPPDLSKVRIAHGSAFWVIKHGLKMTGMPAWGRTHDDITLWSIVAFINKLPGMTPQDYKEMVREAKAGKGTPSPGPAAGIGEHGAHQHGQALGVPG